MTGRFAGLRAWVLQRLSAVYLTLFFGYALGRMLLGAPSSYQEWHALMATPLVNTLSGLFFLALTLHGWVGMRNIIMDYVHRTGVRVLLLTLVAAALAACLFWSWQVLFLAAQG